MVDRMMNEVLIVRTRSRIWRMIQFAVVSLVTVIALMNVFVWQYVISGMGVAVLVLIGFLYFVSFLECFNYYHFSCPECGMEFKTSDFEIEFSRYCLNCSHTFRISFTDSSCKDPQLE
ncbi:MAG: hypothetical protein ABIG42_03155 [bacterium]